MSKQVNQRLPTDIEFLSQVARFWKAQEDKKDCPPNLGRFVIDCCLGHGGFGVVYRAYDPLLDRVVALKVPGVQSLLDASRLHRFMREARHLGSMSHSNIAEIYEANEVDGLCYIAMKYYSRGTLADWLREQTAPIPMVQAMTLFVGIVQGVAAAHAAGLIHRDLKPSNILLDELEPSGGETPSFAFPLRPVVSDFGLAKDLATAEQTLTLDHTRMGTIGYVAPEQLRGNASDVTPAADVYSLGVLLCELLTGAGPKRVPESEVRDESSHSEQTAVITPMRYRSMGDTPGLTQSSLDDEPLLAQLGMASPQRLQSAVCETRPDLPNALARIIARCLRVQPADRFSDASALLEALHGLDFNPGVCLGGSRETAHNHPLFRSITWTTAAAVIIVVGGLLAWTFQRRIAPKADLATATAKTADTQTPRARIGNERDYASRMQSLFRTRSLDSISTLQGGIDEAGSHLNYSTHPPFEARILRAFLETERTFSRPGNPHHVFWSQLSPDNRCVAFTGDKNDILLWDIESNRIVRRYEGMNHGAHRFAFSPDLSVLVAISVPPTEDRSDGVCDVLVWDVESGAIRMQLDQELQIGRVISCEFVSPDEVQFSGFTSAGFTDCRVSLSERQVVQRRFIERGSPDFPAHEPNDELWIEGPQARLRKQWNPNSKCWQLVHHSKHSGSFSRLDLHGNAHAFTWNRQGKIAFVDSVIKEPNGNEHGVRLADLRFVEWDPSVDSQRVLLEIRNSLDVTSMSLSDDGKSMVYSDIDGTVQYRDLSRGVVRVSNATHVPNEVWSVAVHPDGQTILSGADSGWVGESHIAAGPTDLNPLHGDSLVTAVSWRPSARREFASCSFDRTLRLWTADLHSPPKQLVSWEHPDRVRCLAFSRDGRLVASGCDDHVVRVWDCVTHEMVASLTGHTDKIRALAFSIDGRSLFSASNDASVRRWGILDGELMDTEFTASNPICCDVSRDGQKLVFGTQGGVLSIRSLREPADRVDLPVSSDWLRSVAISGDSRTLATGSEDGTIRLWNLATGLFLTDLAKESSAIMSLSFSQDNTTLVAGLYSGEIVSWRCARD